MIGSIYMFNENGENTRLPIQFGWHVDRTRIKIDGQVVAQLSVYSRGLWGTEWGDEYEKWRFDSA